MPNNIGPGILGADGWYVAGGAGSTELPEYVTSLVPNSSVYAGNSGYAFIDNPATTPGSTPSLLQSGTLNPNAGIGGTTVDLSFTFGANVPGEVQVGLMIDNLDFTGFNPSSLQVVEVGGPGASAVVSTTAPEYNDRIPDWLLFDIQPMPGATYQVIAGGAPDGTAALGAVSFDSTTVPEPSTFGLAAIGAAFIALFGRGCLFRRLN